MNGVMEYEWRIGGIYRQVTAERHLTADGEEEEEESATYNGNNDIVMPIIIDA